MAGGKNLTVYLTSDVTKFTRGLNKAEKQAKGFGASVGRVGKAAGLALASGAAAAGLMAVKLGVDGVKAAVDEQKELATLHRAVKNLGFADATASIDDYVDATAKATTASDSDLRPAFTKLLTATRDVTTAQTLMQAALDLSAQAGIPLEAAVAAVAKAQNGQFTALKKLLPGMESLKKKTPEVSDVMRELARITGGAAAAAQDALSGKLDQVTEDFAELEESFGTGFLTGLQNANDGIDGVSTSLQDMGPVFEAFGEQTGDAVTDLAKITAAALGAKNAFDDWRASLPDWGGALVDAAADATGRMLNPLGLISNAVGGVPQQPNSGVPAMRPTPIRRTPTADRSNVDPSRVMTTTRQQVWTADARSAQLAARTNPQP